MFCGGGAGSGIRSLVDVARGGRSVGIARSLPAEAGGVADAATGAADGSGALLCAIAGRGGGVFMPELVTTEGTGDSCNSGAFSGTATGSGLLFSVAGIETESGDESPHSRDTAGTCTGALQTGQRPDRPAQASATVKVCPLGQLSWIDMASM